MTLDQIIFCAPEFKSSLNQSFPGQTTLAYSDNITACNEQVASLDSQDCRQVIILFKGLQNVPSNQTVKDHINLSNHNPLIGPVDLSKGPRFPDMSSVYTSEEGLVAVFGADIDLQKFKEPWLRVTGGIWEAIALKHRGYTIEAWIIADIEKWINETLLFN